MSNSDIKRDILSGMSQKIKKNQSVCWLLSQPANVSTKYNSPTLWLGITAPIHIYCRAKKPGVTPSTSILNDRKDNESMGALSLTLAGLVFWHMTRFDVLSDVLFQPRAIKLRFYMFVRFTSPPRGVQRSMCHVPNAILETDTILVRPVRSLCSRQR